jgi:hypothetical protein
MNRRAWILGSLLLIALTGYAAWNALKGPRYPVQSVTLTNGTTLRLVSVQHGARQFDPFDPRWKQWANALPKAIIQKLKLPTATTLNLPTGEPPLGLWLTSSTVPAQGNYGIRIGDDLDNFSGPVSNIPVGKGLTPDKLHYEGQFFQVLPRRIREWRVRIYDNPYLQENFLHEFRIPNPLPPPTDPPWSAPDPHPTASNGDLEATLTELVVGPPEGAGTPNDPADRQARLALTVRQGGQPTTNWVSYHVERIDDATGNTSDGNNWNHGWRGNTSYVHFSRWPLPTVEPWKLTVEFCQRGGFAEDEIARFLRVPIESSANPFKPMTNRLRQHSVVVHRLGPARWNNSRANPPRRNLELELHTDATDPTNRWHLTVVRAIDSTGLDVTSNAWSGSDDKRSFDLQVATNATHIDVAVAVAPSRRLQFLAQPTVAKPPSPAATPR